MTNTTALKAEPMTTGHDFMDGEDAAMMVASLTDKISIVLQGVDITRGVHPTLGSITIVIPAVGDAILLYPFESHDAFFYK